MERQIPIYFNDVSFSSPLEPLLNVPNTGKTKARVFSKYKNRNGSYITDEVAQELIDSALEMHVPVVGFFDKEADDFTSHVGEDLACAYGYCDDFLGWETHVDNDGVEREYAVFSIFLHTNYFKAANKIVGNPQSMELDPESIEGEWVQMEDEMEYFVYKSAKMKGFTVLGKNVEPCFQGAAFFANNNSRFDKFSALLNEMMSEVKEGGNGKMIFNISGLNNENYASLFQMLNVNFEEDHNFELDEVIYAMDDEFAYSFACGTKKQKKYRYFKNENDELNYELVEEFSCDELKNSLDQQRADFENQINDINAHLTEALQKISEYEAQLKLIEDAKKQNIVDTYSEMLTEDELNPVRANINEYSVDEVESKLATIFARKQFSKAKNRVPLNEEDKRSDLEKLMEKYKKH